MARVTVEDCLEREENRFALVVLAAIRTRQLMRPNVQPYVKARNKPAVVSLREIAGGFVRFNRQSGEAVDEWLATVPGSHHSVPRT